MICGQALHGALASDLINCSPAIGHSETLNLETLVFLWRWERRDIARCSNYQKPSQMLNYGEFRENTYV